MSLSKLSKAVTVAGSDTSGGAGIQADLKTFQERDVYGMTVLTVVVTMDPFNGWAHNSFPLSMEAVEKQFETVLDGIGVNALKTGMLGSPEVIQLTADKIDRFNIDRVVIDPVMVCKGTDEVLFPEAVNAMRELLLPRATVVTPNLFEASQLSKLPALETLDDLKEAATRIHELGPKYVLIKGGRKLNHEKAVDLLFDGQTFELFEADKVDQSNTHGAGCTFSAAITAELAKGRTVLEAVTTAKAFITAAIGNGFKLNEYIGPTRHSAYRLTQQES